MRLRRHAAFCIAFCFTLALTSLLRPCLASDAPYAGHVVIRAELRSLRDVRLMEAIGADMWSHGWRAEGTDYGVDPAQRAAVERAGIPFEVIIPDVAALVDAERARIQQGQADGVAGGSYFDDFRDLATIHARLDEMAAQSPALASTFTVGDSLEGRPIRGIRISSIPEPAPAGTPAILFDACQHAREWATPPTAMYIAERLLEDGATDPAVAALLAGAEVFIIPVVNPDGYHHTWATTERLWRKNRRNNGDGTMGVDLNRNWGYQWGGAGSSATTSSETYRGTGPFSEPETTVMRDWITAHPAIRASIDFHSYSQLILSPWGWTTDAAPHAALHQRLGDAMKGAIQSEGGLNYVAGPIGPTLYLAAGGSVDWTYGDQGILSWTIEVRDTGSYGFVMPPSEILPNARENYRAALTLATAVLPPAIVYSDAPLPTQAEAGEPLALSCSVYSFGAQINSCDIVYRVGTGSWLTSPCAPASGDVWEGSLPPFACGAEVAYFVRASVSGQTATLPAEGALAPIALHVTEQSEIATTDFESDPGWTAGIPGDTATAGVWTRVDPVGTTAQPENDHSANGSMCFVTGQGTAGGAAGAADVDGGTTTLVSAPFSSIEPGTVVSYFRWYSNNLGSNPGTDTFIVEGSSDGSTWVTLESVTASATAWVGASINLEGLLPPSTTTFVRFIASDLGAGSLVEAAIDDFSVSVTGCGVPSADLDGDGDVDGADIATMLGQWGTPGSGDIDGDGAVGGADLALLLAAWG